MAVFDIRYTHARFHGLTFSHIVNDGFLCVTARAAKLVFVWFDAKLNAGAAELGMSLLDMQRPA